MSENNANLSERSIKGSLSKTLLDEIDSIFIKDSTESTNDNAKEHLKTQKNLGLMKKSISLQKYFSN